MVEHLRGDVPIALLPVRIGAVITTLGSELSCRLTFYVRDPISVESGDVLRRVDGTHWSIQRVEFPQYRARWTAVICASLTDCLAPSPSGTHA